MEPNKNELTLIVEQSGLEKTKAESILGLFTPFITRMGEIERDMMKINADAPTPLDSKIAREIRLQLVKNRTAAEGVKKQGKEGLLIEAKLYDSIYNTQANTSKLLEMKLDAVEKFVENQEKARKAALHTERLELLSPFTEQAATFPLGEMAEDAFADLLGGFKAAHEQKIEAARIAEEKRIAEIKAEQERQEAVRLENERLKAEAEAREKELAAERAKAEAERKEQEAKAESERKAAAELLAKQQEEARIEKEKAEAKAAEERRQAEAAAKAERERVEAEMKAQREKAEAEAKAQREAAEKEMAKQKAEAEAQLQAAREQQQKAEAEQKRIAAELAAKKQAEEKEAAKKAAAEKKAAQAPDKEKLLAYAKRLGSAEVPEMSDEATKRIAKGVRALLKKVEQYIIDETAKLAELELA